MNESVTFFKNENKVVEKFVIDLVDFENIDFVNLKNYSELIQEYF